jgi:hypothetical protein
VLLRPSALSFDFQWRQRVTAQWPSGRQSFDAVLQKRAGELILLGLSPLGVPGFVLHLRETGAVEVDNHTGQPLPFEPHYVIADVQRVFFPWFPASGEPAPSDGDRSAQYGDTHVLERYAHGALVERRFERATQHGSEHVRVTYQGSPSSGDAPTHAVLENRLLGYVLTIDTLEQTRLTR